MFSVDRVDDSQGPVSDGTEGSTNTAVRAP